MAEYDGIVIKPYKLWELAALYNVARSTMRRWLKPLLAEIGERLGHYYTIKQVKIIISRLGPPPEEGDD